MGLTILDPLGGNENIEGEYRRLGDVKPGWSSTKDATPHSIASTQGGSGSLNFNASQAGGESDLLIARDVMIDGQMGKFTSNALQGENTSLSVDTFFSRFNANRSASAWATNFYAGEIPLPMGQSVVFGGVTRTIGTGQEILGADTYGDYVYFYAHWWDGFAGVRIPLVYRFTNTGIFMDVWAAEGGTATDSSGQWGGGFTIDKVNGFIYLTNPIAALATGNWVKKFTLTGTYLSQFRPGATSGVVTSGNSLTTDNAGAIYVSGGPSGNVIQKFSAAGVKLAGMGTTSITELSFGFGLKMPLIDFDGTNIIAVNTNKMMIRTYGTALDYTGTLTNFDGYGAHIPTALTVDRENQVMYIMSAISGTEATPTLWVYSARDYGVNGYGLIKSTVINHVNTSYVRGMTTDTHGRLFIPQYQFSPTWSLGFQVYFDRDGQAPLSTMIHYYMCLVVPIQNFNFYFNATDPIVLFPGWEGNVWESLKELGAAWGIEYRTGVSNTNSTGTRFKPNIEVVEIGPYADPLDETDANSLTLSTSVSNAVRSFEVTAQNPTEAVVNSQTVVYESGVDGGTFSVEAGGVVYTQVSVKHSLMYVDSVVPEEEGWNWSPVRKTPGFQVYDRNNLKVDYERFTRYAGHVRAHLIDPNTIGLTLTGPYIEIPGHEGPYKFSDSTGAGRLNISGAGVLVSPQSVTIWTGADEEFITSESGARINSPFISTLGQAYDRSAWASLELSGPTLELRYDVVNQYPSPGQRISYNHQNWRIISVTRRNVTASVTAVPYTTVYDRDQAWLGTTVGQYDTFWSGYRIYDGKVRPLQRTR